MDKMKLKEFIKIGVYFLYKGDDIVYIGKSLNIHSRITTHLNEKKIKFDGIAFNEYKKNSLDYWEKYFIKKYKPEYNIVGLYGQTMSQLVNKYKISKNVLSDYLSDWPINDDGRYNSFNGSTGDCIKDEIYNLSLYLNKYRKKYKGRKRVVMFFRNLEISKLKKHKKEGMQKLNISIAKIDL